MTIPLRYDQLDPARQSRIRANISKLKTSGATDDDIAEYLTTDEGLSPIDGKPAPIVPGAKADATSALPRNRKNASGDIQAATNNPGEQATFVGRGVAANALNAAQGIPGMEALEAGAGALGSHVIGDKPLSYTESRNALRAETDRIPAGVKMAERLVGGGVLAKALPAVRTIKGAAALGAGYGGADAVLNADPDKGVGQRLSDAAIAIPLGGLIGGGAAAGAKLVNKATELGSLAKRVRQAPTLGTESQTHGDAIKAADAANYGAAESEAVAGGGTDPDIQAALNHPRVKPLADEIRESFKLQGVPDDDATVLMQAHRELSQNERSLIDRAANAPTSRPLTDREKKDVAAVKRLLRSAASNLMPSFPPAVGEHAQLAGEKAAGQEGAEHARRLMSGRPVPIKKLDKQSPESADRWAARQSPEKATEALDMALAAGKEGKAVPAWSPNQTVLGAAKGLARPVQRLNRLSPFVDALDKQAGNAPRKSIDLQEILKLMGLANAPLSNP